MSAAPGLTPPRAAGADAGGPAHGSRARYKDEKCRCRVCRAANAASSARRRRAQAYGRPTTDLVDAGPARAHVLGLRAAGMGWQRVAAAAGVSGMTMSRLLGYGGPPQARVTAATAAAILAVRAEPALVDAAPTWRLVRGMVAAGYTKKWIAARLGQTSGGLQLGRETVTRATAAAVAALAEECALTPGPSARARAHAAARGWTPDLLWEDLAGGDDGGRHFVDTVAVERACSGEPVKTTRAEKRAAVARLWAGGHTASDIARRLRLSSRTANLLIVEAEAGRAAAAARLPADAAAVGAGAAAGR